jgi:hypothetical protein
MLVLRDDRLSARPPLLSETFAGGGMTDEQWRNCRDPDKLLVAVEGVATDRQLRLWCCTCVRRVWRRFARIEAGRRAVETAEAYAQGAASSHDLEQANSAAQDAIRRARSLRVKDALRAAAWCAAEVMDALGVARSVGWGATYAAVGREDMARAAVEREAQAELLRRVLGRSGEKQ